MPNPYYNASGNPGTSAPGASAPIRSEYDAIASAFDKFPNPIVANKVMVANGGGTGFTLTSGSFSLAGDVTFSGAFSTVFIAQANASFTLPAANDTLVGRASTDTLTNKTYDTAGAGNLFKINGTSISATTGTGKAVLDTNPTVTGGTFAGTPNFTGAATGLTAAVGTNTTQLATTAFVAAALAAGMLVKPKIFTASGTYTPDANMRSCLILAVGGGGGGSGVPNGGAATGGSNGSGGAGAYSTLLATRATIGGSQTVTVGAKGTGGASGNNAGNAGTTSSVGTLCTAPGGSGGGTSASYGGLGGAGGVPGTGDMSVKGEDGGEGMVLNITGLTFTIPKPGQSQFGGGLGARIRSATLAGTSAGGYGNGGQSGASWNAAGAAAGGDGSAGIVIIYEFCSA